MVSDLIIADGLSANYDIRSGEPATEIARFTPKRKPTSSL